MGVRYQRAADLVELTGILQTTATGLTIDEIADRFDVSRRTAERMLGALRARFPDLRPDLRSGRKYWRLPGRGAARAIQLPRTVDALSERIMALEAEIAASRSEIDALRSISDGVLSTSPMGVMITDARQRVVCTNPTLSKLFGVDAERLMGLSLEEVIRDELGPVVAEPSVLERELGSAPAAANEPPCRVPATGGHGERLLQHWSRPITAGTYTGGRIHRWVDVTDQARVRVSRPVEPPPDPDRLPENASPVLREHVQLLQDATADLLESRDLAPDVKKRLLVLARSQTRIIETVIETIRNGGLKREDMPPSEIFSIAMLLLEPYAKDRKVELRSEIAPGTPSMFSDRAVSISSMVLNVKLTLEAVPDGTTVTLRARLIRDPDRVRLSIVDEGPNLPEEFPQILGRYFPTEEGSGIGIGIQPARDSDGRARGIEQYWEMPAR